MFKWKPLIVWTIALNALIFVGLGHVGGFLFLIELVFLPEVFSWISGGLPFNFGSSDMSILIIVFSSLLGQCALVTTLLYRNFRLAAIQRMVSIILLWTGYFFLSYQFLENKSSAISFYSGIPFLLISVLLFVKSVSEILEISRK